MKVKILYVGGKFTMSEKIIYEDIEFNGYMIHQIYSSKLDVVVYLLNIEDITEETECFKDRIPGERYNKMLRYKNKSDKLLLIGNEILFQYGYGKINLNKDECKVKRKVDSMGKPYIVNSKYYFNMSHAGKYSVCAFSKNPVGVDIELVKPIDLSIARQYYCKNEYEDIVRAPKELRLMRFYQYWVLKESFTKVIGFGLSLPLNAFYFKNKNNNLLSVVHDLNNHNYISQLLFFKSSEYELAICVQAG